MTKRNHKFSYDYYSKPAVHKRLLLSVLMIALAR